MTFDPARVRELLDAERRMLPPWGAAAEVLSDVTRLRGLIVDWHNIASSSLAGVDADAVIAREVAHYRRLGVSVEWTVYAHDEPADLRQRLARHGFEMGPREAVMVLDAAARPSWLDQRSRHPILPVQTQLQLRQFQEIAERVFGGRHHTIACELAAALSVGSLEHVGYLGFDAGTAAAVGRMYTNAGALFAGLYGGGTLFEHRGRGLYRALIARRVHDALAAGARYIRVDALPTSQPILERLGFYELTHAWPCVLRDPSRV